MKTSPKQPGLPVIVGIGASAGGLEALEIFFDQFPPDSGAALVVIQHLSPDFKSLMAELLSRHTSMNIIRVEERELIKPNTVYLISPNKNIRLINRHLVASPLDLNKSPRHPIDFFLKSLADQGTENAIAVILSGTGSDGSEGTAQIKASGGFVIAQSPETCKFDGMPYSIIKRGLADKVLAPSMIPSAITEKLSNVAIDQQTTDLEESNNEFRQILDMLREHAGVDFTRYRSSTVSRRIDRRMQMKQLHTLDEYIDYIDKNPFEIRELHSELLIGVTRFFRDQEAFQEIKDAVIPKIIQNTENNPIRIWIVGCSTGEEAYSIAIEFREIMDAWNINRDLKIFATDVDKEAIAFASAGIYQESVINEMSQERRQKFFVKQDNQYRVTNVIRSIMFSLHNVANDPPFTNLDLVTCRNLLIYFQPKLQAKVLALLHFGLRTNGYLMLGKSEALGELASEFEAVNPSLKIYRKIRDTKLNIQRDLDIHEEVHANLRRLNQPKNLSQRSQHYPPVDPHIVSIYDQLLEEYVPPSILIDDNFNLLHCFGEAYKFLLTPKGRSTLDVQKMLPKELSIALSMATGKAKSTNRDVIYKDIKVKQEDGDSIYQIKAKPFPKIGHSHKSVILVTFEKHIEAPPVDQSEMIDVENYDANKHYLEKISNLESQLRITRESLQSTIEELEATNEELQSTNEELMSSNEELQSSNEELHSVNEELYTVNSEYQSKIKELTTANNDIDFLLRSINLGIIFLDSNCHIRRYNEDIRRFINLMSHDIGRSLSDIKFNYHHEDINKLIKDVLESSESQHLTFKIEESKYLVTAIPYATDYNQSPQMSQVEAKSIASGLVLSFLDISQLIALTV